MTLLNIMLSRRSMLLSGGAAMLTGACASRLSASTPDVQDPYAAMERAPSSSALFYRPANLDLFDTAVHYYDGTYYLVHRSDTPYSNKVRNNEARRNGMDRATFSKDQYAPNGTAISQDGVHWKDTGLTDYDGQVWRAGSGEDGKPRFVAQVGRMLSSRARLYTGSPDLKNWKPLSDQYATLADPRWYDLNGRWAEISTVPRPGGGFFGYWGATPKNGKIGMAVAESSDGLTWQVREPAIFEGFPTAWQGLAQRPEVSAVVAHGGKYYAIVASPFPFTHLTQQVLVSDSPYGPFHPAKKNSRYLVTNNSYFSRFVHAPDGVLVNHQSWEAPPEGIRNDFAKTDYGVLAKTGHLSPLKRADWDEEGTMRLKWWDGNDKAKARAVPLESPLIETKFDMGETLILEGEMMLSSYYSGLYLQGSGDSGTAIKVHKNGIVEYGDFGADGISFDIKGYVDRELRLSDSARFRLVRKGRMTEFYLNDYLMQIYSPPEFGTGCIGLIGPVEKFSDLRAWYCS